mgnify:FL=1
MTDRPKAPILGTLQRLSGQLAAIPVILCLSSCIALPVTVGEESRLEEDKLDFIVVGTSTKRTIASSMHAHLADSEPGRSTGRVAPVEFRTGDWWLYTQVRREGKWLIGGMGGGGLTGGEDYRFLLIKFDSSGVVYEYEVSKSEGNECNLAGVCIGNAPPAELLAPFEEDRVAKQFSAPGDRCQVYVYGTPNLKHAQRKVIPILLDGNVVGQIVDWKQYFSWQLDPGLYRLNTLNKNSKSNIPQLFDCEPGKLYFFEFFGYDIELQKRHILDARATIRKRWLTLGTI